MRTCSYLIFQKINIKKTMVYLIDINGNHDLRKKKDVFPFDDAFFNRNWAGACWNRWAGLLALDVGLLYKNKKQRGSAGARPLPFRCLSQFFPDVEKINCLESEFSAYLSPMGWPGIYSRCFSRLDGDKNSLLLDEGFSFLIVVKLIRDN